MSKAQARAAMQFSLEKINRQDGSLFKELSDTFEGLMQLSIVDQNDINQSRLSSVIRKYTGMDVTFTLHDHTYDAYTHLVQVDKNHVFFHQRSKLICHSTNNYKTEKTEVVGHVNLKNGTVSGVFSKFPVKIGIGSLFIVGIEGEKSAFTADELTAIIIHELGHSFTTFEYLSRTVMTGLVIGSAVRETAGIPNPDERTKVIMKASENANLAVDEKFIAEVLKKHGDKSDVVILSEHVKRSNLLSKTNVYDARNCEQIADQFAVSHGAGAALGSALEKLHKYSYDINYRNTFMYVTIEVIKVISFMFLGSVLFSAFGLLGMGLGLIVLISDVASHKIYDDPKDRLIFIKRQMVDDLKKLNYEKIKNKPLIQNMLDSISEIEDRIEDVKDRKPFTTAFYDAVTPWGRNREQQEAKAKQLEEVLNNDLFIDAARIATR